MGEKEGEGREGQGPSLSTKNLEEREIHQDHASLQ